MIINKQKTSKLLLFLVGIFCQIQPILGRSITAVFLGFCFVLFFYSIDKKQFPISIGFIWYLLFTAFCLLSLSYTINNINPDFVYRRIISYLLLIFLITPFLKNEENFKHIPLGFVFGGLIGIFIVLTKQYHLIGVKRLGAGIYGSYAEFGNVCMLATASFIWLKNKINLSKIIKLIIFMILVVGIFVSGARKAILVPMLMFIFLKLLDKRNKFSKKIIFVLTITMLSLVLVFAVLNNQYLYKLIGYRIDSGIASVLGDKDEDESLLERSSFKKLGYEMIVEKPIFGWGIHSFAIKNYQYHNYKKTFLLYSHDGFIEILSCYGVFGFVLFYWSFLYIFLNRKKLLYDDIGIFLISYIVIILLMEPYSICFLNSYYLIMVASCLDIIKRRRIKNEKNV